MLNEISKPRKHRCHLHAVLRAVKLAKAEVDQPLLGAGEMKGCCLLGVEFQFLKIQQALGIDGDGCITM